MKAIKSFYFIFITFVILNNFEGLLATVAPGETFDACVSYLGSGCLNEDTTGLKFNQTSSLGNDTYPGYIQTVDMSSYLMSTSNPLVFHLVVIISADNGGLLPASAKRLGYSNSMNITVGSQGDGITYTPYYNKGFSITGVYASAYDYYGSLIVTESGAGTSSPDIKGNVYFPSSDDIGDSVSAIVMTFSITEIGITSQAITSSPLTTHPLTTALTTGSITSARITSQALTTMPLTTALTTKGVTSSAITSSPITSHAVTSALTTKGVTSSALTSGAITSNQLTTSPLTTSPLTTMGVTSSAVSSGAVTSGAVTSNVLTTSPLTTSPLSTSPLSTGEATSSKVTTSPLTTSPLSTSPLSTGEATSSKITTSPLSTGQVTSSHVTTNPITSSKGTSGHLVTSNRPAGIGGLSTTALLNSANAQSNNGLGLGPLIGIIIAAIVAACCIPIAAFLIWKRKKKQKKQAPGGDIEMKGTKWEDS